MVNAQCNIQKILLSYALETYTVLLNQCHSDKQKSKKITIKNKNNYQSYWPCGVNRFLVWNRLPVPWTTHLDEHGCFRMCETALPDVEREAGDENGGVGLPWQRQRDE